MESPVRTIETNVNGTQLILEAACKKKKLVLLASTSEVYGKNTQVPFHEDADLVLGPTTKGRWSYAASKALDEFLALSYWKEKKQPVIVVRFFNTVGPRQTGRYGMVLPNFVQRALTKRADRGLWRRQAVALLLRCARHRRSRPEIDSSGARRGRSRQHRQHRRNHHRSLAAMVKERTESSSPIQYIPYDKAYEPGFEDMMRRVPSIDKLHSSDRISSTNHACRKSSTGFRPITSKKMDFCGGGNAVFQISLQRA